MEFDLELFLFLNEVVFCVVLHGRDGEHVREGAVHPEHPAGRVQGHAGGHALPLRLSQPVGGLLHFLFSKTFRCQWQDGCAKQLFLPVCRIKMMSN